MILAEEEDSSRDAQNGMESAAGVRIWEGKWNWCAAWGSCLMQCSILLPADCNW